MKKSLFILLAFLPLLIVKGQSAINFTTQVSNTTKSLFAVTFADTARGYISGENGTILKTINGGATWTNISPVFGGIFWDIKVLPGTNGQSVLAAGDSSKVILSTNGGSTWTQISVPLQSGSFIFGIQILSGTTWALACGEAGVFQGAVLISTNSGTSWSKVSFPSSVFIEKTWLTDTANGYIVGNFTGFIDGACYKKSNSTYNLSKSVANLLTNLWVFNPNKIISVGLGGEIWKTNDGGTNWVSKAYNNQDLYDVHFVDSLNGFACGGVTSNIILRTVNGGETWTPINFSTNGYLQSMDIVNKHVYMVGLGGSVIKTILKPVTPPNPVGIEDLENTASYSVYPNPTSETIFIKSSVNKQMHVDIYDMQGKKILTSEFTKEGAISLSELSEGLYQLKISDAAGTHYTSRISRK